MVSMKGMMRGQVTVQKQPPPRTSPHKRKTTTDNCEETPERSGWGNSPVREISPRRMSNVQKAIFSMKSEAVSDENAFSCSSDIHSQNHYNYS